MPASFDVFLFAQMEPSDAVQLASPSCVKFCKPFSPSINVVQPGPEGPLVAQPASAKATAIKAAANAEIRFMGDLLFDGKTDDIRVTPPDYKLLMSRCNPAIHLRFQHVERHIAVFQQFVVERSQVECWPQLVLRALAQLAELECGGLVRERLSRPCHEALGRLLIAPLGIVVQRRAERVLAHEIDRLISRPAFRMNADVYHEEHGSPQRAVQPGKPLEGVVVQTKLPA